MRVLQLHNHQLALGGIEKVRDADTCTLQRAGAEIADFEVDNADIQGMSRITAGAKAVWNLRACHDLAALVREFEPHVAHVYTPFPIMSPAVFRVLNSAGVPTVASVQSFRYSCIKAVLYRDGSVCESCVGRTLKFDGIRHRCYHDSVLGSLAMTAGLVLHSRIGSFRNAVDVWLAPTEFSGRRLLAEGIPADRVVVKPNTTPDPGFTRGAVGDHVVFGGRLVPEKGVRALLAAWASHPDLPPLRIMGEGVMRPAVERAVSADSRVSFLGWADQDTVIREVSEARFLIFPSEWYEGGHPVIAVQALAVGTPLIASDVGNFDEMVIPGVTGYLFRSGDPASLGDTVARAWRATEGGGLERMRQGARRAYEDAHSEDRHAKILRSAYRRAIEARSPRFLTESVDWLTR